MSFVTYGGRKSATMNNSSYIKRILYNEMRFSALIETPIGARGTLELPLLYHRLRHSYTVYVGSVECKGSTLEDLVKAISIKTDIKFLDENVADHCIKL